MIESYDINDYLKDDKELQKAVIRELFKEISTQQGKIDAYKMSENEANEIIAELQAYKDINEDFKTAWEKLKAENERLKKDKIGLHSEIKQLEQENYGLNQELLGYKKGVQASEIIELKQTLQEIKAIAKHIMTSDTEKWTLDEPFKQIEKILELTKAEEEWKYYI